MLPVDGQVAEGSITLDFPHYDSRVELRGNSSQLDGVWTKVRGANKVARVSCSAQKIGNWDSDRKTQTSTAVSPFAGRFQVQFEDSTDPAIGIFQPSQNQSNRFTGTFLTTTGDYRFLGGLATDEELTLSCFDGGHAFLFTAQLLDSRDPTKGFSGKFYSGNWYEEAWTAKADDDIRLPDGFDQTQLLAAFSDRSLLNLKDFNAEFPDLVGAKHSIASNISLGQVTLIEIFGSWCPNCHDEAALLKELRRKYGPNSLQVLGLAFELTGDIQRDGAQVKKYVARYEVDYPILIAGTSDKALASKQLPWLDRIRSYPTTIFVDKFGKIRAIYTGFSGPATGEAHQRLRRRFRELIEKLLAE